MYKKCDFCKIKKFRVEYSKGHYICPSCEKIIDNYNKFINNCFNNYRYTRENLEKEKHIKDTINELRNIHSNKIIIENQKIEVEKQTIEIGDLIQIMYCENALLIGETESLAYPIFRYLMWLEDRNILWVDKESEKIFFELHKDKKPNPSVDFKTVEQFNKDKGINDFKSYSRIYLNSAIDNIETVHAAQISIKNKPTTVRTQNPEYGLFLKEYYDTILIFNPNSENGKKKIIKTFQEHNIELENEVESFNEINEAIILWRDVISKDIRKNFIIIDIEDFDPEFPLNVTNKENKDE